MASVAGGIRLGEAPRYREFPMLQHRAQMARWFRKEIRSVEDLKGLKMRLGPSAALCSRVLASIKRCLGRASLSPRSARNMQGPKKRKSRRDATARGDFP
jgi:hypothetical protein